MASYTLGVIILWFGWFGFDPGSTLGIVTGDRLGYFAYVARDDERRAAGGALGAVAVSWIVIKKPDLSTMLNGVIAALVAITAACGFVAPSSAIVIGAVAGLIAVSACSRSSGSASTIRSAPSPSTGCRRVGHAATGIFAVPRARGEPRHRQRLVYTGSFHQVGVQAMGLLAVGRSRSPRRSGPLGDEADVRGSAVEPEVETAGSTSPSTECGAIPSSTSRFPGATVRNRTGTWASGTHAAPRLRRRSGAGVETGWGRRVAFPGGAGAQRRGVRRGAELVPLQSFRAVADGGRPARLWACCRSSSVSGPVAETHDLLFESPLAVIAQAVLPIRHQLVGPAPIVLQELRVVRSHPHALEQCGGCSPAFRAGHRGGGCDDRRCSAHRRGGGDPTHAAITSPRAAELYDLVVLDHDVGDHPEAFTRFVAIATHIQLERDEASAYRTSFSFVTDHRPGALHDALEPFARLAVDLHHLSSRPIPQTPWRYRFDAVLAGHPLDPPIRQALGEASARTRRLLVSGVYPE